MKNFFITVMLLLLAATVTHAQIVGPNARAKREYKKQRTAAIQEGFEIVPFPGEFPTDVEQPVAKRDGTMADPSNWGSVLLNQNAVWADILAKWKAPVHIRIVDTSPGANHPFLQKGQTKGQSFTSVKDDTDKNGHGTHCTGIIAILLKPAIDKGLVTFENDQILSASGSGNFNDFATCEETLLAQDKTMLQSGKQVVVSCSFGGGTAKVDAVEAAMKKHYDIGVPYLIANGNTGGEGINYPGNSAYAIPCASLEQSLKHANYSTYGVGAFGAMPGSGIYSTWLNGQYATLSGTSMATPALAAITAVAKGLYPELNTNERLKQYLSWIATDLETTGWDKYTGYGVQYIIAIASKNPKDMPATPPVNPPNPPNPPVTPPTDSIPVHAVRNLQFTLELNRTLYWDIAGAAAAKPSAVPATTYKVTKKMLSAAAMKPITVTTITVQVNNSKTTADFEYKRLKKNLEWYATNRGFGLKPGSDNADALYWIAYFAEMIIDAQRPTAERQDINILKISGKDAGGNPVEFDAANLLHWLK